MRVLRGVARYEFRLLQRTLRIRIGVPALLVVSTAGSISLALTERRFSGRVPGTAYLESLERSIAFTSILLCALVVGNHLGSAGFTEILRSARVSHLGMQLRRYGVYLGLLLPLSTVPILAGVAIARFATTEEADLDRALFLWSLVVAPRVLSATAVFLALVTILRSEVAAFLAASLGGIFTLNLVNRLLLSTGLQFGGGDWWGFGSAQRALTEGIALWRPASSWLRSPVLHSDEAPIDWLLSWQQQWPAMAWPLAISSCLLVLSSGYLRRRHPDYRPIEVVTDHPLRTVARLLTRLRANLKPDPDVTPRARLASTGLIGLAVLSMAALALRSEGYRSQLEEMYGGHLEPWEPTPVGVAVSSYRIQGAFTGRGHWTGRASVTLSNQGTTPVDRLAFELDAGVGVDSVVVSSVERAGRSPVADSQPSGSALGRVERRAERLLVFLERPLEPAEERRFEFAVRGRPGKLEPALRNYPRYSLTTAYGAHRSSESLRSRSNLALSNKRTFPSSRFSRLALSALGPVPRFSSWQLEAEKYSDFAHRVPEERRRVVAPLELELSVDGSWFLADSCGITGSRNDREPRPRTHLRSGCRSALNEYTLVAADRETLSGGAGVLLAIYPQHRDRARGLLDALERVVTLSGRAWPDHPELAGLVGVEVPASELEPSRAPDATRAEPLVLGRLVLLPEGALRQRRPVAGEALVATLMAREMLPADTLEAEEHRLMVALLRTVMLNRMGLGEATAVLSGRPWERAGRRLSPRDLLVTEPSWAEEKVAALTNQLEHRIGSERLLSRLDELLERRDLGLESLVVEIESADTGKPRPPWRQMWLATYQPEPALAFARGTTTAGLARVEIGVTNPGEGVAVCELEVRSGTQRLRRWVELPTGSSTWTVELESKPHTVLLDPEEKCLRFRSQNHSDRRRIELAS